VRAITLPASIIWRTASGASSGGSAIPFGSAVALCTPSPAVTGRGTSTEGAAAPFVRSGLGVLAGACSGLAALGSGVASPATGSTTLASWSSGSGGSSVAGAGAAATVARWGAACSSLAHPAAARHAATAPISAVLRITSSMDTLQASAVAAEA